MKKIWVFILFISLTGCFSSSDKDIYHYKIDGLVNKGTWTIMIYMCADNNLETYSLLDVQEMVEGFKTDNGYQIIIMLDRADGSVQGSTNEIGPFEENFSDTRLYMLVDNGIKRLSGKDHFPEITTSGAFEADMGDPENLKKFITFCKNEYKADKYALFFWNHGTGPRSFSNSLPEQRAICVDYGANDSSLGTGEISAYLSKNESVELIGFDACYMGSLEVAYQFAPQHEGFSAKIMVASADEEWAPGWNYKYILNRLSKQNGDRYINEKNYVIEETENKIIYNPLNMNAADFASIIVEEYYAAVTEQDAFDQVFAAYNLYNIYEIKNIFDSYSGKISLNKEEIVNNRNNFVHYFNFDSDFGQLETPFFDYYDIVNHLEKNLIIVKGDLSNVVDEAVLFSFAGSSLRHKGFVNGCSGLSIFFPDGDTLFDNGNEYFSCWDYQWWYSPFVLENSDGYGNLYWCRDNASEGNGIVENWFEILEYWFGEESLNENNYIY